MHSRKDHLLESKLAQFDGNILSWHEWFGQLKSTVDSTVLTDYTKLTYLKALVTSKARNRNCGVYLLSTKMYWPPCNGNFGNRMLFLTCAS